MPFIDTKLTMQVSQEKRDILKEKLGKAISILNKPESYLMLGFEDQYDLYFGGKKMELGAYVSVSLFGESTSSSYEKMTAEICKILKDQLGIPENAVYVTYHGIQDWGWNGRNF